MSPMKAECEYDEVMDIQKIIALINHSAPNIKQYQLVETKRMYNTHSLEKRHKMSRKDHYYSSIRESEESKSNQRV